MGNLMYAINIVLPLVLLVALGYFLRKIKLLDEGFSNGANKLVFYLGIPALLFKAIYDADFSNVNVSYILFIIISLFAFFIIGWIVYGIVYRKSGKVGTVLQSLMRSNYTLIGIPLVLMIFSEGSAEYANASALVSLVAAFFLPCNTILSVLALALCDKKENVNIKQTLLNALKGIVKNPLIISIFIGLVFSLGRYFFFPGVYFLKDNLAPVYKVINYLSQLSTPLALIMVGTKFRLSATKSLAKYIVGGVVAKNIIIPGVVFSLALFVFKFSPAEIACLFAAYAAPTAVSSVPVVERMGGDSELGGQLVVFTTLICPFVIVALLTVIKSLGVV